MQPWRHRLAAPGSRNLQSSASPRYVGQCASRGRCWERRRPETRRRHGERSPHSAAAQGSQRCAWIAGAGAGCPCSVGRRAQFGWSSRCGSRRGKGADGAASRTKPTPAERDFRASAGVRGCGCAPGGGTCERACELRTARKSGLRIEQRAAAATFATRGVALPRCCHERFRFAMHASAAAGVRSDAQGACAVFQESVQSSGPV